jgi:hypothetical protein
LLSMGVHYYRYKMKDMSRIILNSLPECVTKKNSLPESECAQ